MEGLKDPLRKNCKMNKTRNEESWRQKRTGKRTGEEDEGRRPEKRQLKDVTNTESLDLSLSLSLSVSFHFKSSRPQEMLK